MTNGRDTARGGFFSSGPLGRPADQRDKLYWAQAEALFGLLRMWQATGDGIYLDCLAETLAWVDDHAGRPRPRRLARRDLAERREQG